MKDLRDQYREALLATTALKQSMEHSLKSDPNAVWRHSSYRHYMRKYVQLVEHIRSRVPISVPLDMWDIAKVSSSGDTTMPVQKELFEAVHANLSILEAFLVAKSDLPAEKSEGLRYFLQANLRKAIFEEPSHEKEVQNAIEQLLIGRGLEKGVDYDREVGRVKVSVKEVIPDFILPPLQMAIEVKLSKTEAKPKALVDEINADIKSYSIKYERILFIVYDLGTIRDTNEFTKDLQQTAGVHVVVVKH